MRVRLPERGGEDGGRSKMGVAPPRTELFEHSLAVRSVAPGAPFLGALHPLRLRCNAASFHPLVKRHFVFVATVESRGSLGSAGSVCEPCRRR
jgi:hypothetical protein